MLYHQKIYYKDNNAKFWFILIFININLDYFNLF